MYAEGFNFGPDETVNVKEIADMVCEFYGKGTVVSDNAEHPHEANILMLDASKSKQILNWKIKYNTRKAVQKTVEWYKKYYEGENMKAFSLEQIKEYIDE